MKATSGRDIAGHLFTVKNSTKGTLDLSNPYVHSLFTLLLIKLIFENHRRQQPLATLFLSRYNYVKKLKKDLNETKSLFKTKLDMAISKSPSFNRSRQSFCELIVSWDQRKVRGCADYSFRKRFRNYRPGLVGKMTISTVPHMA